ncbi:AzlC family ABC transporter permease [Phaeobacter inhibens]|uniref:AzlC family ABC transporter permease n=1 Tax=Phaeobacter inhibens TaxID=221822 RepID=UPI0021A5D865|nr:AzlC family ABC transporter permease [Phaeobacter inhibens]UWR45495.1 AzlC family ABC transporter permease [Phaeobacter inhibens]UWR53315.1 AzlC family ABC transporter permease [Phaeobacter inhibens]UWR61024.1 AzlC family ABC transporter permease [Phaeobacter inhibens]UWR68876.1 AzlC family ABC transporter permease [Phaeobacter inhibens]UWR72806.1 AzlC family ABC transporter permease [Phaeobacter inhibens]
MAITTTKSAFWKGFRDGAPFLLVSGPFGLLFGVLAAEAGLIVPEAMIFSLSVFAGSAQFTALQLMEENTPLVIILISALAVNLRVAMYSASLTPYLGGAPLWQRACAAYLTVDQSYALSIVQFETHPQMTLSQRMAYFFGTNGCVAPGWMVATYIGALVGTQIPASWGLDFVLPLAFLAMIGPMLRTPAHVAACFAAVVTALPATALPYNLGLIVAGLVGMMAGAQAEVWLERRQIAKDPS